MAKPLPENNPFNPGPGTTPPHVAGRKKERQLIEKALKRIDQPLVDGRLSLAPLAPIKLVGLRGVGKTTLISIAKREAERRDIKVIAYSHLKDLKLGEGYDEMLASVRQPYETESTTSGGVNTGIKAERSVRAKKREDSYPLLLEERVRENSVLILMDEAMHYDTHLLEKLLQHTQRLIQDDLPLAVIMAGTPALNRHLRRIDASFIARALSCPIHHLSAEEVREALREPFAQYGVQVSEDALELLATWTDNYPYFVQLAGEKAWDAIGEAGRSELDMEIAQQAAPAMQEARDNHYRWMFATIEEAKLLDQASHLVALIETAEQSMYPEHLRDQLAEAAGLEEDHCREAFAKLLDLGLIWTTDEDKVIAGIPSFFSFFKSRRQAVRS